MRRCLYRFLRFGCQIYSLYNLTSWYCWGGWGGESLGFDCFPLRIVGLVSDTWVVSLGFRNCLPFLVFVFTILLEDVLSGLFGVVFFYLFWSLFCWGNWMFLILFNVSVWAFTLSNTAVVLFNIWDDFWSIEVLRFSVTHSRLTSNSVTHSSSLFLCVDTDVKRSFTLFRLWSVLVDNPSIALKINWVHCFIMATSCFKLLMSCLRSTGTFLQVKHTQIPIGSSFWIPTQYSWNHCMQNVHCIMPYFSLKIFLLYRSRSIVLIWRGCLNLYWRWYVLNPSTLHWQFLSVWR